MKNLIKILNGSEIAGRFVVDSGQFVIFSSEWTDHEMELVEKRIPIHAPSGAAIDQSYLQCWQEPVPEVGYSLNELMDRAELKMKVAKLSTDLTYQGCCDTTLYREHHSGFLDDNRAFASTCYVGDGIYPVFKHKDGNGFSVTTGFLEEYRDLTSQATCVWIGELDTSEAALLTIGDPCYGGGHSESISVHAASYKVGLVWAYRDRKGREPHGMVIFRAV